MSDPASLKSDSQTFQRRRTLWIGSAENFLDRYATAGFLLLACFTVIWAWIESHSKPLWYDELLGLAASMAPNFRDIPAALALPVDINPPLYHMLARCSIDLLGYSATAARLPALLAMLIFLYCLFVFVSRKLGPSFGLLAALLVLCSPVSVYAWEARPYTLVLSFTGIAMVLYQRRMASNSSGALLGIVLCCACLPLTHYYGTLVIGAFVAAEILRAIERKRPDWPLLTGMLLAPGISLFLLRNVIRSQRPAIQHYHSRGGVTAFLTGYDTFITTPWVICIALAGLALIYWLQAPAREEIRAWNSPGLSAPELLLAGALLALPILGSIASKFTHAYVSRYFIAASAGYAILLCYLAASFQRRCSGVALVLSAAAAAGLFFDLRTTLQLRHDAPPMTGLLATLKNSNGPVVFEAAKDYLMARQLSPNLSARFYYASQPELAVKMIGIDTDDKLMRSLTKIQPVQVRTLDEMAQINEVWTVIPGSSFGWLLPCFAEMGSTVQFLSSEGTSAIPLFSSFKMRLPRPGAAPVAWCQANAGNRTP
jgi:hypothetical protein